MVLATWHVDVLPHIAAVLIVALVVMTARWMLHVRDTVKNIDDAVNRRHTKTTDDGNPAPKLYDLALENHSRIDGTDKRLRDHIDDEDFQFDRLHGEMKAGFSTNEAEHRDLRDRLGERDN